MSRDQKAVELVEELIATARHMSAMKRSWIIYRLQEGLGTDSRDAESALMAKETALWLRRRRSDGA